MAWRVKEAEVRGLIELDEGDTLAPFIDTANAITDKVNTEDDAGLLTAALLVEIEKYLAAHFAEHRHQQFASESTLSASATYQGKYGMGLSSSKWGQTAMIMDVTGYLRALDEGVEEAGIEWMGLPPSEQTDYVDRN